VLRDVIQPFPTFSEIYLNALKALASDIAAAREPVGTGASQNGGINDARVDLDA
jgi:hypothetical protein